jgi:hypothetical protein
MGISKRVNREVFIKINIVTGEVTHCNGISPQIINFEKFVVGNSIYFVNDEE